MEHMLLLYLNCHENIPISQISRSNIDYKVAKHDKKLSEVDVNMLFCF